ncbi:MAG: hypothetical protein JWM57_2425 [Phycisphaerales bacterium]|nr:hypothetical protein [Phycisphaerales bacterium]
MIKRPAHLRVTSLCSAVMVVVCCGFCAAQTPTTEPASTRPSGLPDLVWPEGWVVKPVAGGKTIHAAINADAGAGGLFAAYPRSDYAHGLTLKDWAAHRIDLLMHSGSYKGASFGTARDEKVGDHDAVVIEFDNTLNTAKMHHEHLYFQVGDSFCSLGVWTPPSRWDDFKPVIASLVNLVR